MKKLVMVAGLQYSGKSTLCRRIAKENSRYHNISLDEQYEKLAKDWGKVMDMTRELAPLTFTEMMRVSVEAGAISNHDKVSAYYHFMKAKGRGKEFHGVQTVLTVADTASYILNQNIEFPMIDAVMVNKLARKIFYGTFRGIVTGTDDVPKLLIHFDLGLDESLKRYKKDKKRKNNVVHCDENMIRENHQKQQLPSKDEWPNLEVIVIKNMNQIHKAVEMVIKE